MILHLSKQLSLMDASVRGGNWSIRNKNLAVEINGKTLGVVGMGKIGSLVAKLCNALGMKILAYDPYVVKKLKQQYEFTTLENIFKESDFVTIHCPNTPETKGMITEALFKFHEAHGLSNKHIPGRCGRRGSAHKSIKRKRIAGAGLDVFHKEPVNSDNELLKLDNVILSPHSAAMTKEATIKLAVGAVNAVIDFFEGKTPKYIYKGK